MLVNSRFLLTAVFALCLGGAIVQFTLEQRLVAAAPWLLVLAASVVAVIRWVRPQIEDDAMRSQWRKGFLAGLAYRQQEEGSAVVPLRAGRRRG